MTEKPDPFDIEALGNAVNDSASRVSAIWISFLVFSLYLLIAATTVTQRQLFLADPVKLPVLNIDLPLWGFFFLAPILFVILHIYVLLQVLLLAHTAATYNSAVDRAGFAAEESASLRQRLANTLFAQIFAGAPRERGGWIGWLLKAMAWLTLAVAPVLILVVFQFAFLAYHSHLATWTHRLLILAELVIAFVFWPLIFDDGRDFEWARIWIECKRAVSLPHRLFGPKNRRHEEWIWLRRYATLLAFCALYVLVSLSLATFPGEPHVNLLTGHMPFSVQCDRWFQAQFESVDLRFDRLVLEGIHIIADEKLATIAARAEHDERAPWQSERSHTLYGRDLNCSELSSTDLREIDLRNAHMRGAIIFFADLDGASLENAQLQGAHLNGTSLRGASLYNAQLQGVPLIGAKLQGANLNEAQLQGANLGFAELQGARLSGTQLQGANFSNSQLQGAFIEYAQLQGTSFVGALLQGAHVFTSQLQGADLTNAGLQGADFKGTNMDYSILIDVGSWRASNATCAKAKVGSLKTTRAIDVKNFRSATEDEELEHDTFEDAEDFIQHSVANIAHIDSKRRTTTQMRNGLIADPANDNTADLGKAWSACEEEVQKIPQEKFDRERAALLQNLVCDASEDRAAIALGIIRNWISRPDAKVSALSVQLARGLLGQDGKECAATKDFDEATKNKLRAATAIALDAAPPEK